MWEFATHGIGTRLGGHPDKNRGSGTDPPHASYNESPERQVIMTPERWQVVKALYHAALARAAGEREAYLAKACGADDSRRRKVEPLLSEPASAAFLNEPAMAVAARLVADGDAPDLTCGWRIANRAANTPERNPSLR